MTGNPVRQNVLETTVTVEEARKQFGLAPEKKTILLVGGSLGARTINESVLKTWIKLPKVISSLSGKQVSITRHPSLNR